MLLCRQHLGLLRMVGVSRAARTAGLASSALPTAGAPAEVVPADASPLAGLAWASLPCPLTAPHVARFLAVCRTSPRAHTLRLASLVRRASRATRGAGAQPSRAHVSQPQHGLARSPPWSRWR